MTKPPKYHNLNPKKHKRSRAWQVDFDYIDKLSDTEKALLNQFAGEYYNATIPQTNALHTRDAYSSLTNKDGYNLTLRQEIWHIADANRRDASSLPFGASFDPDLYSTGNPEDHLIALLDLKKKLGL